MVARYFVSWKRRGCWLVIFLPEAEEDLEDLGSATRKRCLAKIEWLASHPEVLGKKPLRHLPIALKGLNSYPVYREAHLALAQLFRETGRLTDAEAEYRKLLKIDSEDVQAHLSLGLLFEEQELYKQALKEY